MILGCFSGCGSDAQTPGTTEAPNLETVDFASNLKLNMGTFTKKLEVTVKNFVDGDTVHFHVPESVMPGGVFKARFLAINTPESTGKIEPYGKAASNYTKEALKNAESIIIESDTAEWNADSTGNRYLVWVWYKTAEMTDYRNLNLEILQNGLAIASNTNSNIYGSICTSALEQARRLKLNVFSGQKDPDFYDGAAVELTLKELRTNIESYRDILVAFNCVITSNSNNTVYVEQYDPETEMYYGISIYYGNSGVGGDGLKILSIGNEARIVGKVQYYETGATWQISGLKYRAMKPDDPENIQLISSGHNAAYVLTDANTFVNGKHDVIVRDPETEEEKTVTMDYASLAMNTSIEMKNLKVKEAYTTDNEDSSSNGAMTLTCEVDGTQIIVRTAVLRNAEGKLITQDAYLGKTIDVRGIIDFYDGEYQIKVFTQDQITIH
jgi:micrococcal nuclease